MGRIADYLMLMRPYQWYKNVLVFIALFFTGSLFDMSLLGLSFIGFASLCLVSSANYVVNDLFDYQSDKFHPEKKKRPIAAGRVSIVGAFIFAVVLFISAAVISYMLSPYFFLCIALLFALTLTYSLKFKGEPFLDIILISINFVIRAVSGVFIISSEISPWLIITAFFLALFLAASKRKSDSILLGKDAKKHKKVFFAYTPPVMDSLITISASLLIISFSLYSFLKGHSMLLVLLPVIVYILFRYIYLVNIGSPVGRHPHLMYADFRIMFAGLVSLIVLLVVFYG